MAHVGENIKRIRTAKKMTISDVANEHVSRGMISLIENGKTQPSIERLQHIAKQLDVDISELVEEVPREELRNVLAKALELIKQQEFNQVIKLLEPIIEKRPTNYEGARLNELYAKSSYFHYINEGTGRKNDWQSYTMDAIRIYEELQMGAGIIRCWSFLASVEYDRAQYDEVLRIIDGVVNQFTVLDSYETKAVYIDIVSSKAITLMSLGRHKDAHAVIDGLIEFSKEHIVLTNYYWLLNVKVWLYYGEKEMEKARKYVEQARVFVQLLQLDWLEMEFLLTQISLQEFFEEEYDKALLIADQLYEKASALKELSFLSIILNFRARVLTKQGHYKEALELFRENPIVWNERIQLNPLDAAIRRIAGSYEALCLDHVGEHAKAEILARETVDKLRNMPHSAFYQFARNVLDTILKSKN